MGGGHDDKSSLLKAQSCVPHTLTVCLLQASTRALNTAVMEESISGSAPLEQSTWAWSWSRTAAAIIACDTCATLPDGTGQ